MDFKISSPMEFPKSVCSSQLTAIVCIHCEDVDVRRQCEYGDVVLPYSFVFDGDKGTTSISPEKLTWKEHVCIAENW